MSDNFNRRQAGRRLVAAINVVREILLRANSCGSTRPISDRDLGENIQPDADWPCCRRTVARARRDLVDLGVLTATKTPVGHVYALQLHGCGGALDAVS